MKVEYIDHMGDDLAVVNAARVSLDKESEWGDWLCPCGGAEKTGCGGNGTACSFRWPELKDGDAKLIHYLANHNHWTPFAHTAIKLRVSAPVPIRTQCFKHKVGFVENEESRRYISSTPELYVPEVFRKKPEGSIKQGSAGPHPYSDAVRRVYKTVARKAIAEYEWMIRLGVCPEQARFILPQGVKVNWIWTGNLAAFARFYKQRTDPHAQQEVRELAQKVGEIIAPLFPVSWKALTDG